MVVRLDSTGTGGKDIGLWIVYSRRCLGDTSDSSMVKSDSPSPSRNWKCRCPVPTSISAYRCAVSTNSPPPIERSTEFLFTSRT